jgi:hypothetical protein
MASDIEAESLDPRAQAGVGILVSYRELAKLNERLARIDSKVDTALRLPAKVDALTDRVASLETERAVRDARGGVFSKIGDLLWALVLALIAAGVWWPKLPFH